VQLNESGEKEILFKCICVIAGAHGRKIQVHVIAKANNRAIESGQKVQLSGAYGQLKLWTCKYREESQSCVMVGPHFFKCRVQRGKLAESGEKKFKYASSRDVVKSASQGE
jgi:hypothetical protein